MRWQVHQGDILDVQADVLVCPANVYLALSGGVGGAFLLRYGPAMQEALQQYLAGRGVSSPAVVARVLAESLRQAAALVARTVALTAVATGYGRMSMRDFAAGLRLVIVEAFPPLQRVTVGLRSSDDVEELLALIPELERPELFAPADRPHD
jgi:O-acetyl-ADP-ribose deacetylase (regulator of RNase III)